MSNPLHHNTAPGGPDVIGPETQALRDEVARLREEVSELKRTCLVLAAPMCWATDGSSRSAITQITRYVRSLEASLGERAKA